jgi:hypothetical protein
LVGRKAGAAAGYQYSPALKTAGFAWDQTSFAAFIVDPRGKIPGNKMVFAGIKNQTEIAHRELGEPARVLRVEVGPSTSLGPSQVRFRLSYAPIQPGDLHGVTGTPAFGTPPTVAFGR